MNISKFTQKSVQAVQDLEKVAYEYGNQEIEQEHLLYTLLTQEDSLILKLIEKMEINKDYFIDTVKKAFEEQRKINFMLAKDKSFEVDGYSGFVFTAKSGRPLMPYGVNSVLYNIVDAYNKAEVQKAKKEHRKAELLPKVSAHVMRHTACTRMAECRMDIKVLQYIMGHAHFDVTMEVYNHLGDRARIENEIAKLDSMAVNF